MQNKYEILPELKKYIQGMSTAYIMVLSSFTLLKYENIIKASSSSRIALFFSFILFLLCIGMGILIYRKQNVKWPHFLAGFITYLIIGISFTDLFFLL